MMNNGKCNPTLRKVVQWKTTPSIESSSAAQIFSGLVDDLLIEIFKFLPARSLVRFIVVSKHWCSLISTPSFARLHVLHHSCRLPEPQSFILSGWFSQFFICQRFSERLVRFNFRLPYVRILQSCNGLLLLECRESPLSTTLIYTVFNPTTMQYRILIKREAPLLLGLFFDPSKSPYYKVVCFERSNDHDQISVFESRNNAWKEEGTSEVHSAVHSNLVYWNNGVYFLNSLGQVIRLSSDGSFCDIVPPPINRGRGAEIKTYIMEANGHLYYLVLSLMANDNCLIVYEMSDDGSDWVIKYAADFNRISAARRIKCCLIGMVRGDREEDSVVLIHKPGKIMLYTFTERTFKVLVNFKGEEYYEEDELQFGVTKPAFPFIGSLAAV